MLNWKDVKCHTKICHLGEGTVRFPFENEQWEKLSGEQRLLQCYLLSCKKGIFVYLKYGTFYNVANKII